LNGGKDKMKNTMGWQSLGVALAILCVGVVSAPAQTSKPKPHRVRSYTQLLKILKQHQPRYFSSFRTGLTVMADAAASAGGSSSVGHSSTTVQVAGVDEGDEVKNDGAYIYQLNQSRVLIIHAYPDTSLGVVSTLDYTNGSFYPQELYLDTQYLVVVGTAFHDPPQPYPWLRVTTLMRPIWYFSTSTVQAKIYDITDPANPAKVREVEIDGDYVATRKIGSDLYLVSRQYPNFYATGTANVGGVRTALPSIRDTARSKRFRNLKMSDCYYLPGFDDPDYLVVAGVDLSNPKSTVNANAYLGAGDQVYASLQNLYVTASRYIDVYFMQPLALSTTAAVTGAPAAAEAAGMTAALVPVDVPPVVVQPPDESTDLYRFALNNGNPTFVSGNNVPGTIQNSYSMDENGDYFRVATTQHAWWDSSSVDSNNVYVLDADMNLVGSLEGVAPGEQIYAARFVGSRLFLVTFQQIDPLFAIDLSDPTNPIIVGQLTLPGYSQFLLPYDENHLIGIGKDVIIAQGQATNGDVAWWNGRAFYQGMKIALFDVTDLKNPALMYSVSIGDRGTDSPALWDPHAILFDRLLNLLALPISVATVSNPDPNNPWQWGDTVFQGAYVYNVSLDNGFVLKGAVTHHLPGEDPAANWDWNADIDRVLYIGNDLFTLSMDRLKVNDLDTLTEKATLELPEPPQDDSGGGVVLLMIQSVLPAITK
jgi:inhibitor of cysteine peptidase